MTQVAERDTTFSSRSFRPTGGLGSAASVRIEMYPDSLLGGARLTNALRSLWLEPVIEAIRDLAELKPGWNDEGAPAIDARSVSQALQFLAAEVSPWTAAPSVVPTPTGGVQLEWHRGGLDVEIEFNANEEPRLSLGERDNVASRWHGPLSRGVLRFNEIAHSLRDPKFSSIATFGW
jgi:hypothetical protein